jgi:hypothetical protein
VTCQVWQAFSPTRCGKPSKYLTGVIKSCGCPTGPSEVCEEHMHAYLVCRDCKQPTSHTEAVEI